MSDQTQNIVTEVTPIEAFEVLKADAGSILVDVRTRAEWIFVGTPDLSEMNKDPILLEWQGFPEMQVNTNYASDLMNGLGDQTPTGIYFLCRSGARSLAAADAVARECDSRGITLDCVNIIGGFEGDPDSSNHRGRVNGWKAQSLAWRQR